MKIIGYIIMMNIKFRVNTNGKWQSLETGYHLEFKKKIYIEKESAIEAVEQLKLCYKNDEYEIHPIYWEKI